MTNTIVGLAELQKKLNKIRGIKDDPSTAMLAGAYVLEKFVKEDGDVPVLTGFLLGSGESRRTEKGAEYLQSAEYAFFVEFGTSRMAAQPFLRPAIDNHSQDIVDAVGKQIQDDIDKARGG